MPSTCLRSPFALLSSSRFPCNRPKKYIICAAAIRLAHASSYIIHRLRQSIENIFLIICLG